MQVLIFLGCFTVVFFSDGIKFRQAQRFFPPSDVLFWNLIFFFAFLLLSSFRYREIQLGDCWAAAAKRWEKIDMQMDFSFKFSRLVVGFSGKVAEALLMSLEWWDFYATSRSDSSLCEKLDELWCSDELSLSDVKFVAAPLPLVWSSCSFLILSCSSRLTLRHFALRFLNQTCERSIKLAYWDIIQDQIQLEVFPHMNYEKLCKGRLSHLKSHEKLLKREHQTISC